MEWSEKVTIISETLKLNQRQLAAKTEVSPAYINDIIKGKNSNPSAKFVAALAKIGVSTKWLLKDEGDILDSSRNNSISIPLLDAEVSAGFGVMNDYLGQPPIVGELDIPKEIALRYPEKTFLGLRVSGDSMEPKLHNGDYVVAVNGMVQGEGIYIVCIDNLWCIKRVIFLPEKNQLILRSDNPNYEDRVFNLDCYDQYVRIVGTVVFVGTFIR